MYLIVLSIIILIYLNCVYNRKQSGGGGVKEYCNNNPKTCIGIVIFIILLILLLIWLLWPSDETTPTPTTSPTPTPPISTSKTYCELNPNPCENGGKCISDDPDSYICDCYDDFYGDRCELEFDDDIELDSCYDHFDNSDCKHGVKDRPCHGRYCNREHCCRHRHSPTPPPGPSPGPPPGPSPAPSPAPFTLGMNVDKEGKVINCQMDNDCTSKVCDPDTNTCLNITNDKNDTCYYISASNVEDPSLNLDLNLLDTGYPVKSNKHSGFICPFGSTEATVEGLSHERLCDPYNKNCEKINKRTNDQNKFKTFIETFIDGIHIRKPSIAYSQKNDKKHYKVTSYEKNSCWDEN